ncbi:MAG: hypothetical protein ACRDM7_03260 [Thermoleophilaceae bacterium]
MRKLALTAIAACAVLAVASVAYAANTYTLDSGTTKPKGVGTPAKPLPKGVNFDYSVGTDDGTRPSPVKVYSIRFQGLISYAKFFPKCTFAQASQKSLAAVQAACKKAAVGGGVVENLFGATADTTQKQPCNLKLRLYNLGNGLAIRLDRDQVGDCPIDPSTAINAKYKRMKLGGKPTDALNFTVPDNLTHPIGGIDNAVVRAQSNVKLLKKKVRIKGKQRTVGLYSSIGCGKRNKRLIQVGFTAESGEKSTANKTVPC